MEERERKGGELGMRVRRWRVTSFLSRSPSSSGRASHTTHSGKRANSRFEAHLRLLLADQPARDKVLLLRPRLGNRTLQIPLPPLPAMQVPITRFMLQTASVPSCAVCRKRRKRLLLRSAIHPLLLRLLPLRKLLPLDSQLQRIKLRFESRYPPVVVRHDLRRDGGGGGSGGAVGRDERAGGRGFLFERGEALFELGKAATSDNVPVSTDLRSEEARKRTSPPRLRSRPFRAVSAVQQEAPRKRSRRLRHDTSYTAPCRVLRTSSVPSSLVSQALRSRVETPGRTFCFLHKLHAIALLALGNK